MALTSAGIVFTAAAYFHHPRFLRIFAVFSAVFASFFRHTVTGGMRTLLLIRVRHDSAPFDLFGVYRRTADLDRQACPDDDANHYDAQLSSVVAHRDSRSLAYPTGSDALLRRC